MADSHTEHAEHGHHVVSNKVLNQTFGLLTFLMLATIAAARAPIDGPKYFPGMDAFFKQWEYAWQLTNFIALGIATVKAVQVIRFFMGAQYASKLSKIFAIGGFVGFSLLFILFFDYVGRPWEPVRGWEKVPATAFPRNFKNDGGIPYKEYPGNEGHGKELHGNEAVDRGGAPAANTGH